MIGRMVLQYRVTGRLGFGGMGIVYEAEDTLLSRRVALKFLPDELAGDPEAKRRLRREAQAIAALNHPHICTCTRLPKMKARHLSRWSTWRAWISGTTWRGGCYPRRTSLASRCR